MAATLPLELQQHIFQYLDPRSFHASRKVCRWWRYASQDSVTLASQLRQLPISPEVSAKTLGSERLQSLYGHAAHTLMLGMQVDSPKCDSRSLEERVEKSKLAVSKDMRRAATLEDREITWWNIEKPQCEAIARRPLNDLRTAIGGGPWFKCAPTTVYELALSSDGNILAIALERTIQIYDLSAGEESWPVSSYIPSASGHYIAGLQFQHNNSLLRVQLSNKGAVVYLGTPQDEPQGLQHWQGKGGLKHAFLDSSQAVLRPLSAIRVPESLAGLQLLRPFQNGWLFAAQKSCAATQSACYCVGHVAASDIHGHVSTAEKNASVLVELPSSMSTTPLPEIVHGFWRDLPSALVQHPHFSLSNDGSLLAMSENVGMAGFSGDFSRVFVFRLPTPERLAATLETVRVEHAEEKQDVVSDKLSHAIQRLPLSIGTVNGKVLDFTFDDLDVSGTQARYQLSTITQFELKTWSLQDS